MLGPGTRGQRSPGGSRRRSPATRGCGSGPIAGGACRWLAQGVEAGGELVPFRQIRREVAADSGESRQVGVVWIEAGIRKLLSVHRESPGFRCAERIDLRHEGRIYL